MDRVIYLEAKLLNSGEGCRSLPIVIPPFCQPHQSAYLLLPLIPSCKRQLNDHKIQRIWVGLKRWNLVLREGNDVTRFQGETSRLASCQFDLSECDSCVIEETRKLSSLWETMFRMGETEVNRALFEWTPFSPFHQRHHCESFPDFCFWIHLFISASNSRSSKFNWQQIRNQPKTNSHWFENSIQPNSIHLPFKLYDATHSLLSFSRFKNSILKLHQTD